jgi:hypothetical protein
MRENEKIQYPCNRGPCNHNCAGCSVRAVGRGATSGGLCEGAGGTQDADFLAVLADIQSHDALDQPDNAQPQLTLGQAQTAPDADFLAMLADIQSHDALDQPDNVQPGLTFEQAQTAPDADLQALLADLQTHDIVLADGDDVGSVADRDASTLGVELSEPTNGSAYDLNVPAARGVVVAKVVPDSAAGKAGLKQNDVILEINGQRLDNAGHFWRMIGEITPVCAVPFTVWRDDRMYSISVIVGSAGEGYIPK